jgi:hypothetical protein
MKKKLNNNLISFLLFGFAVFSAVLHNLIFALFKYEEPVFFILTLVFLLATIISVFYSIVKGLIKKKEK